MTLVDIHTHRPAAGVPTLLTAGIHPWLADRHDIACAGALKSALGESLAQAQAIGETGLDFACTADRGAQERLFRAHLELAAEMRLPVVIHCVRAFGPVMKILGEYRPERVLFHGFIGSAEQARQAVGRGYFLSFGLRSLRSPRTVEAMRSVPPGRLFLETDDDGITIAEIFGMAAAALGTGTAVLAEQTNENYKQFTENGQLA